MERIKIPRESAEAGRVRPAASLLLVTLAALLPLAGAAAPPTQYSIQAIAMSGDPVPGAGTLQAFALSQYRDLDPAGRVVFQATTGSGAQFVALYEGGQLSDVVHQGEFYGTPGSPRFSVGGNFIWRYVSLDDPLVPPYGVMMPEAYGAQCIWFAGGVAPAPPWYSVDVAISEMHAANPRGDVLLQIRSTFTGAESIEHLEIIPAAPPWNFSYVASQGQVAPAGHSDTWGYFAGPRPGHTWRAALNNVGEVVFRTELTGGTGTQHGVYRWLPYDGSLSAFLLPGDPMQEPPYGHFVSLGDVISMNDAGEVAIEADWERSGDVSTGVFVVTASSQRSVVRRGDELPGTGGQHFRGLQGGAPRINASGDVTFTAATEEGGRGLFVTRGHVLERVDVAGREASGRAGVTLGDIIDDALINDAGQLLVLASTNAGDGLFLLTPFPPSVPLAPAIAHVTLAALILAVAGARRR